MMACVNPVTAQCGSTISTFPYSEDFEISQGGWTSGGIADDWAWGIPVKPLISSAGSGQKCWITGGLLNALYNSGERSWVQSPCFDFSGLLNPQILFSVFWETEKQYDGGNLQYSVNGGNTWSNVGSYSDTTDCMNAGWYNAASITNLSLATVKEGWSGTMQPTSGSCLGGSGSGTWVQAKHVMSSLAGQSQVIFRFTFASGTTCNDYDGFAFDQVRIQEAPALPVISWTSEPAGCDSADGSIALQVTGGANPLQYHWTPFVSTDSLATGLAAGIYSITIQDSIGCMVTELALVSSSPAVNLLISPLPDTCLLGKGLVESVPSGGTPPFQFTWNTGQTAAAIQSLLSGTYTVTVTDSKGCTTEGVAVVTETGSISVNLGPDLEICGNGNVDLLPGNFSSYLWQDGSILPSYPVSIPGSYAVTVTGPDGCTASDSMEVIENCLQDVLLPGAFTPNGDGFNDILFASGINLSSFYMEIRNRWGGRVFQSSNQGMGWNGRSGNTDSPEGIYVWKIIFRTGQSDEKEKNGTVLLIR